jgi:hypothetical protein
MDTNALRTGANASYAARQISAPACFGAYRLSQVAHKRLTNLYDINLHKLGNLYNLRHTSESEDGDVIVFKKNFHKKLKVKSTETSLLNCAHHDKIAATDFMAVFCLHI